MAISNPIVLFVLLLLTAVSVVHAEDSQVEKKPAEKEPVEKKLAEKPPADKKQDEEAKADEAKEESKPSQEVAKKSSTTDITLELMGEFVGTISRDGSSKKFGLQLRTTGKRDFQALLIPGGLPGAGGEIPEVPRPSVQEKNSDLVIDPNVGMSPAGRKAFQVVPALVGRLSDETLILSGFDAAIFVNRDGCKFIDSEGELVGRFDRVRRVSPTLGARPPEGAIVLFNGEEPSLLSGAEVTSEGLLKEGFQIAPMIQDFDLHLEFRIPYMPMMDSQKRGNSGIYLHSRYESQVLDSFATPPLFNGLGAVYRTFPPRLNMALPPLVWQTYDIRFTAPRFLASGEKFSNARISSWINGVIVQDDVEIPNKTGHGKPEEPILLPTHIQDHNDPVRFRNMWMIDRGIHHVDFPVMAE
ncbi:MAG: DUF1080 domain-containing protein [Planctomycetota bacterium]